LSAETGSQPLWHKPDDPVRVVGGDVDVATGVDHDAPDAEEVRAIEDGDPQPYVASWHPQPGETDVDIMLGLKAMLDANGLPATYNSLDGTLTNPQPRGHAAAKPIA
jgi:hypothetical protein